MNSDETLKVQDLDTQIVIIGGGGAGLAAAVAAAEKEAKVILLEKRSTLGGNTALATGIFAAESPAQHRAMIDVPRDSLFRRAMDYYHWKTDPRIVRTIIDKSGDTIRWLEEKGVQFRVLNVYPDQFPQIQHVPEKPAKYTAGLVKALAKSCKDLGVRLLYQTAAKRILIDEKGGVIGILGAAKGKEFRVTARIVIIATGGYAGNKELLRKYYPSYSENMQLVGLPHMGDGLLMAIEVGAATDVFGLLQLAGFRLAGTSSNRRHSTLLSSVGQNRNMLWVNKKGERFTDESVSSHGEQGNMLERQPDKICYALFDAKIKQSIIEEGPWRLRTRLPKIEPAELEEAFRAEAERGTVKISDSWEEIAKWIGITPEILRDTIGEYNSFCNQGYDEIFCKDRRYLLALNTPPYYCIKGCLGFMGTEGGIRINHRMEVVNDQDSPIPGLYAVGDCAGGWEAVSHGVKVLAGVGVGFAVNAGRIAGENAAKYVSEKIVPRPRVGR